MSNFLKNNNFQLNAEVPYKICTPYSLTIFLKISQKCDYYLFQLNDKYRVKQDCNSFINKQIDKEYFTYLKIVKETLTFILPSSAQYEEYFQQSKVIIGDIHIVILQLTNWLIFYYSDAKGEPNQFSLNISNTLKPQIQNYFIRKSNLQGMQIYYKEKQLNKLENLIRNRIFQQQKGNVLIKLVENRDVSILIYSYLKRRDMMNLELSCFNVRELFVENSYWYQLYEWKYGQTGFKLDAFSWKNKFILLMKC